MSNIWKGHSSGAVWESRWPSWAVRPNEPSGFSIGLSLSLICQLTSEDIKQHYLPTYLCKGRNLFLHPVNQDGNIRGNTYFAKTIQLRQLEITAGSCAGTRKPWAGKAGKAHHAMLDSRKSKTTINNSFLYAYFGLFLMHTKLSLKQFLFVEFKNNKKTWICLGPLFFSSSSPFQQFTVLRVLHKTNITTTVCLFTHLKLTFRHFLFIQIVHKRLERSESWDTRIQRICYSIFNITQTGSFCNRLH